MFFRKALYLIAFEVAMAGIIVCSIWTGIQYSRLLDDSKDQTSLSIPFQKVRDSSDDYLGRNSWSVTLVLKPRYYTKENLERIFRFYSEKYPNKKQILIVKIFPGVDCYERYQRKLPFIGVVFGAFNQSDQEPVAEAEFCRVCDKEFYSYSPDIKNPSKVEEVVMKRRSVFLPIFEECE